MEILQFAIDQTQYAVPLSRVLEVVPRVWLTPLPEAPAHVAGVFAYRGTIAVALDIRARLGHAPQPPRITDHLVITAGKKRPIAVIADQAVGLRQIGVDAIQPAPVTGGPISGIVTLPDGLLLVDDLDEVLSLDDEVATERGIAEISR